MYLTKIQRRILEALRHEPLNMFVLADQLDEPPYRVRAELKGLRRDRVVTDAYNDHGDYIWKLTDRGHSAALAGDQEELFS